MPWLWQVHVSSPKGCPHKRPRSSRAVAPGEFWAPNPGRGSCWPQPSPQVCQCLSLCWFLDAMMELAGADHTELDGQQEMDDFEEENSYGYGAVGNPPDEHTLAEQAMKEMAYYNML